MKHFTLLVLAVLASLSATAENRSRQELLNIANSVLQDKFAASPVETRASSPLEILYGNKELSVAGRKSGGFVVLANDDAVSPVLGYSSSSYTVGDENPAFKMWLEATTHAIETRTISADTHKPDGIPTEVASFITTKWNQDAPYNILCPTYTTDKGATKYYPTGCVATAMAQAMYYYKYPEHGTSKRTYRFDPGTGVEETVSVQLDTIKFDWDNMLDSYKGDYTDAQAKAVAELMKACGSSVEMMYSKDGSGAYAEQLNYALRRYFGYDPGLPFHYNGMETTEEFYSALYYSLAEKQPVIFCASSTSGGHCFILDGYDDEGLVSVNWGWGGQQDGIFNITSLNGYSDNQSFTPLTNKGFYPEFHSKFVLYDGSVNFSQVGDTHIKVATTDRPLNMGSETYKGKFFVVAQDMKTGEAVSIATFTPTPTTTYTVQVYYYATDGNLTKPYITISGKLDDGDYRLFLASKSDEEKSYSPFRTLDGKENSYLMTISDGKITSLTVDTNAAWMVTGIEQVPAEKQQQGSGKLYNVNGQQVDASYHGVVIKEGKKYVQ